MEHETQDGMNAEDYQGFYRCKLQVLRRDGRKGERTR